MQRQYAGILVLMNTQPLLFTRRLTLRNLTLADAPRLFVLRSNTEVMRYIPKPRAQSEAEMTEVIKGMQEEMEAGRSHGWAITLAGTHELIGMIGFVHLNRESATAEIRYMLLPEYSGKGIMREALQCAIDYGFNVLNLRRISAVTHAENHAAQYVLLRCGFTREGVAREQLWYDGETHTRVYYGLLSSDPR